MNFEFGLDWSNGFKPLERWVRLLILFITGVSIPRKEFSKNSHP